MNEGHIIKAIYESEKNSWMKRLPTEKILASITTARNLSVELTKFDSSFSIKSPTLIRRATEEDKHLLLSFIKENFGNGWLETIENAFIQAKIPLFLAEEKGEIIGVSSYDVYLHKKGLYGPMGVLEKSRNNNVGKGLLYTALKDMKDRGYYYAILGEEGPIEYYEKVCNAKLITYI
ncbi:N-acetylglutamate synthase-like GNAT family acetyltransferase [Bacillus pakistanensis]|uniref:N-acetylglutamate synthase-like GNAT family acetyltransferase n=1 Tax=Rossellomorea pakistanensis TaxID=992288 RepID=A0ABS2N8K1_9BACI|nr:GNAT family N-acetyltransferase [Bacillus pakistanensis]MBM7584197.1 N-acetylglutamate synthase-like GNAT family acetyltransferase [Bacillus pakistanensis]